MDLGRVDLLTRIGLFAHVRKDSWLPLVGYLKIRFRRELNLFQGFELHTQVLAWDTKWFYLEQRFLRGKEVMALSHVQLVIKKGRETIPPQQAFERLGHVGPSPKMSPALRLWVESQEALANEERDG
jgi:acyl-CoA thioesterase FadM